MPFLFGSSGSSSRPLFESSSSTTNIQHCASTSRKPSVNNMAKSSSLFRSSTSASSDSSRLRASRSVLRNPFRGSGGAKAASPPPSYAEANAPEARVPSASAQPPAYERHSRGAHPPITSQQASTAEDPYAFLSTFNTILLIDDSGSMWGNGWKEARTVMERIVPILVEHSGTGSQEDNRTCLYFMNHKTGDAGDANSGIAGTGYRNIASVAEVQNIFRSVDPNGNTPTGQRLHLILKNYLNRYEQQVKATGDETSLRPLNVIVITDGAPSDDVEGVVIQAAQKLDRLEAPPYQVGVQFFQVGNESGAAEALRQLDDELGSRTREGVRDIVDTVTFDIYSSRGRVKELTTDCILKTVLGAVTRRLDRHRLERN
ncbi:hypothetical protein BX600DRAFT_451111 [Xylariales sp. PMI_506]|nr:hypothetical protein BX600DRAFT_451111 [Xylariales sp. PMI_506]